MNLQRKKLKYMGKQFHENVFSAVKDELEANKKFQYINNGQILYVGIILDVLSVGGFDRKAKRDESKGSFIEQVKKREFIKTYNTRDLIDAGYLLFIPTKETINSMDEYGFLRKAEYEIGFITDSGVVFTLNSEDSTEKPNMMSFETIKEIVESDVTMQEIISGKNNNTNDEEEVLDEQPEENINDNEAETEDDMEELEFASENADDEGEPEEEIEPESVQDEIVSGKHDIKEEKEDELHMDEKVEQPEEQTSEEKLGLDNSMSDYTEADVVKNNQPEEDVQESENEMEDYDEEEPEEDAHIDVPDEEVDRTFERLFKTSDIPFDVDLDMFDKLFKDEGVTYLKTNRSTVPGTDNAFINAYANEKAKACNEKLAELHKQNRIALRQNYIKLLHMSANTVTNEYSLEGDGDYAKAYSDLKQKLEDKRAGFQSDVDQKKQNLIEEYDRNKDVAVEQAKIEAGIRYDNLNKSALERKLNNVEKKLDDDMEANYAELFRKFNDNRIKDAVAAFERSQTAIIKKLSDDYKSYNGREKKVIESYNAEIEQFIKDNMKMSIEAKNAELELLNATALKKDYDNKVEDLKKEQKEMYSKKQTDLEDVFKLKSQKYENKIDSLNDTITSLKEKYELEKKKFNADLDDRIRKENELSQFKIEKANLEIAEAKKDANDWKKKSDEVSRMQRFTYGTVVALATVAVIAACSIGYLRGLNVSAIQAKNKVETNIVEQFDKQLKDLKADYEKKQTNEQKTNENDKKDEKVENN